MLQQTQVKTVIPFFERFIQKLPNIETLSKSKLKTIYNIWQGLGYYSRARNLLKTAKIIKKNYKGKIPKDYEILKTLPGIGSYTASAIMAIAHNQNYIGVDANVERFVSRLFGLKNSHFNYKEIFLEKLNSIKSQNKFSKYAQALMEIGALICTPKNPNCLLCPVKKFCIAFLKKDFEFKIHIKNKKKINKYFLLYSKNKNKILFQKSSNNLLKDFSNLPLIEQKEFFNSEFKKNYFFFSKKPIILKKKFTHYISNIKMLITVLIFTDIYKINSSKMFWIIKQDMNNKLLSSFSKKFINLIEEKNKNYV